MRPGIYRHYEGGLYRLLFTGRLTEERQQEMCVYVSLSPGGSYGEGQIWIRPLEMWTQNVPWPDGIEGSRFEWVRP